MRVLHSLAFGCFDKNKNLKVVLAEVNNTFNERHGYLCFEKDMSPIKYTNRMTNCLHMDLKVYVCVASYSLVVGIASVV